MIYDGSNNGNILLRVCNSVKLVLEHFKVVRAFTCMCAKSLQLCSTLCDPMDDGPPGFSVHGVLRQGD